MTDLPLHISHCEIVRIARAPQSHARGSFHVPVNFPLQLLACLDLSFLGAGVTRVEVVVGPGWADDMAKDWVVAMATATILRRDFPMLFAVCADEFRFLHYHHHHPHCLHLVHGELMVTELALADRPLLLLRRSGLSHIEAFAGSNGRPLAGGEEKPSVVFMSVGG